MTCGPDGDFNCNGTVEGADLTLLLNNWAKPIPATTIPGWTGNPQPTAPAIDGDELTALLSHWAQHIPGTGAGAAVPEPTSVALALVGLAGFGIVVRRGRGSK